MTDTLTRDRAAAPVMGTTRRSLMPWVIGLVLIAVIAGGIVAWLMLRGPGEPTVTFDGVEATYSGPDTFVVNQSDVFTFDNSAYDEDVMVIIAQLRDPMTLEELEADAAIRPASEGKPDYIALFTMHYVPAGEITEPSVVLAGEGTWVVTVQTAPDDTDTVFVADLVEATAD